MSRAVALFKLMTPSQIRYTAPENLRDLKAQADCNRITEMPTAEMVAWMNRPQQIPKLVKTPSQQPPRLALRMTNTVSTPGVIVKRVIATK